MSFLSALATVGRAACEAAEGKGIGTQRLGVRGYRYAPQVSTTSNACSERSRGSHSVV